MENDPEKVGASRSHPHLHKVEQSAIVQTIQSRQGFDIFCKQYKHEIISVQISRILHVLHVSQVILLHPAGG